MKKIIANIIVLICIVCAINAYSQDSINEIVIPSYDELPLNPTLEQVNNAIINYNTLQSAVDRMVVEVKFMELKRTLAKTAYDSIGITRVKNLRNVTVELVLKSYTGAINTFIDRLINLNESIDRQQAWAVACYDLIDYIYGTLYPADLKRMAQYCVALILKRRYESNNPYSSNTVNRLILLELPSTYYPSYDRPRFHCMGNPRRSTTPCLETFKLPYEARSTHKIWCGGYKDPDPNIAGCGKSYYKCQPKVRAKHKPHSCILATKYYEYVESKKKWLIYKLQTCGHQFRNCWSNSSKRAPHAFYRDSQNPNIFSRSDFKNHVGYVPRRRK